MWILERTREGRVALGVRAQFGMSVCHRIPCKDAQLSLWPAISVPCAVSGEANGLGAA